MNPLTEYINNLYETLIGKVPSEDETLIKLHTRFLEDLGDLSFPVSLKNWYHLTRKPTNNDSDTIFGYRLAEEGDVDHALVHLVETLNSVNIKIQTYRIIKNSAHLYLEKTTLFTKGIHSALVEASNYGKIGLFDQQIRIMYDKEKLPDSYDDLDLTTLRLYTVKKTIENLLKFTCQSDSNHTFQVNISQNSQAASLSIQCGPVINEKGVKDNDHKASDFFKKRITDMQLMAQHRYRVNLNSGSKWNDLFEKLGKASVTIELLSNKPHKAVKVTLNDLSSANKGPSFIFYNCARLAILLKEFQSKVNKAVYPHLPELDTIDLSLLKQPEEWELLYAYVLQFPFVIKSCVRGVEKGLVNPQHLISFLSGLSSVFSVYYRRVRILTDPRDHMFSLIHSRIYLLQAIQVVFHNALKILNIEPIEEM